MVSQLLVAYVRDRLSHGYSAAETRQLFMNRGWRGSDVDAAIQVAQGNRPPAQAQPSQPSFSNRPQQSQPAPAQMPARQPSRERTLMNAPSYSVSIDTGRLVQVLGGLVAMLIVLGIAYIVFFQGPSSTRFELKVMSGEKALDGAEVRAYDEGKLVGTTKTVQGVAVFTNLPPKVLTFKISKPGYGELEENYDTSAGQTTVTEMLAVNATAANQTAGNATATPTATPTALLAPLVSGVSVNATNVTAVIKWATNTPTNSTVLYGLSTAYGASAGIQESVNAHSVTLSNLTVNKTYYYKIVGCAVSSGKANCTNSPGSFVTFVQTATPTCSGTAIGQCIPGTSDQCIADQFAGAVPYPMCSLCGCPSGFCTAAGTCATATPTPTATPTSTPSCTVGGTCGTTSCPSGYSGSCTQYYSSSCACTACTPSCTLLAPTLSGAAYGSVTDTAAIITWTTDLPSNSTVYYGTTSAYGSTAQISDNVTSHSVPLGSLTSGTMYYFKARSCNSAGCANSTGGSFATTGASVLNYISISPVAPNTNVTNGSQLQFTSVAYYSNGSTPSVTTVAAWSFDNAGIGVIGSGTGTFIALNSVGQGTVTVSFGGKSNTTTLLVQKQVYTYLALSASSVPWGTSTTATCAASEGQTPVLTRNGATVSSPDTATLAAGSYPYACTFAQTQSYIGYANSSTLTVVPKPVSCSLSLAPSSGANGTSVTATASANESATIVLSAPAWCPVVGTGCTGSADNSTSASFTASVAAGNYSGCTNTTSFAFT